MTAPDQPDAAKAASFIHPWWIFVEGGCPRCGDDILASPDGEGLYTDGDHAWCASCGLKGQVVVDEGRADFSEYEDQTDDE